jgi:hypothetical protein
MRVDCKLYFEEEHEREQEEEKEYLHWIKHSFYRHFYSLIFKFKMGYVVPDIAAAKNYVIANGVALLLTYAVLYFPRRSTTHANSSQFASMSQAQRNRITSWRDCSRRVAHSTGSEWQVPVP